MSGLCMMELLPGWTDFGRAVGFLGSHKFRNGYAVDFYVLLDRFWTFSYIQQFYTQYQQSCTQIRYGRRRYLAALFILAVK